MPSIGTVAGFDPDGNLVAQTQTIGGQTRSFGATLNPADWPQQATNDGLGSGTTGAGSGDLLAQTIQNGAGTVSYNIDQLGRQNAVGVVSIGSTTPLTTTFAFNNNDQMTAEALPNAVEQDVQYDGANRLSSLTAQNTANPALLNTSYQYGYNPLGLMASIVTTVQGVAATQTLTHDAAGRLVSVAGGASPGSWAYDGRGNLTSATANGTTRNYSYNPSNPEEVASVSASGQPTVSYGYDAAGDTTSIADTGTLSEGLSYDAQARLVQVTLGSPITSTIALAYNAFGQRSGYTVTPTGAGGPSLAEAFKYQGDQLAQVAYTGTSVTTPYTDTYVYTQDGAPLELLAPDGGHGHAVLVRDRRAEQRGGADGQRRRRGRQLQLRPVGQADQRAGERAAAAALRRLLVRQRAGWYWLSVRSYDPALERFLQPDPSEQEGLFSYVYAGDSPSDLGDASGLLAAPQTGCLETANGNFECNVQVGSPSGSRVEQPQWAGAPGRRRAGGFAGSSDAGGLRRYHAGLHD